MKTNKNDRAKYKYLLFLALLLIFMIIISIAVGSSQISIKKFFQALLRGDGADLIYKIIIFIRIPRTIAAVAAGAALAVAGAILQSVLNNALASPNIIGVNSGSGLFVVLLTAFFPQFLAYVPIAAFAGALSAAMLIYFIAYKSGASRITIILAGVAISSFFSAAIDAVMTLDPDSIVSASSFMIGGFSAVNSDILHFALFYIAAGLFVAMFFRRAMNVLSLGDDIATSLGMRVGIMRFTLIIIAAMLAGSAVSFAGLLGFVGLIIPHISRSFIGSDNRFLIPASALSGAFFVLLCDFISRIAFAPYELPVGIMLSAIGGPFFIYLLFKQRRGKLYD
jgi:iron complex transport system permease protein